MDEKLMSAMAELDIRFGAVFWLPGSMHAYGPTDALRDLIEDDLVESSAIETLAADWPDYKRLADYVQAEADEDSGAGLSMREVSEIAVGLWCERIIGFGGRSCPFQFLVCVEAGVNTCVSADPRQELVGSWRGGFGHYVTIFRFSNDLEQTAREEVDRQKAKMLESWQKAVDKGLVKGRVLGGQEKG